MTLPRILACSLLITATSAHAQTAPPASVFGFRDFAPQARWDAAFLKVPDAALAGQHLKILTAEPHWASSPEDYKTAQYVAEKFKAAGLAAEIVPYRVLLNKPKSILIEAFGPQGQKLMSGPTPEHVDPTDPFENDPRVLPAFNGSSASGDVTAQVLYANYGTQADFRKLDALGISVKGKIVLVRYGQNFRGVKTYIAQQHGAVGVLIYSDPADDGYFRGDLYPNGPYRPESAVQRGSSQFLPIYPGDPQTPGVASTMDLPDSQRIPADKLQANQPSIPVNPLSYKDAAPILRALAGPNVPHAWQGALPFPYHLGAGKVTVHMHLEQDYAIRTIWDVIGRIPGADPAEQENWVVAGNHRDAWVYGAVDPNSGTAAMLETVHGLGELLKQGWKPKRPIVIASWDAEEEGLIGSTEWVEQHQDALRHAVAYFNTDVGVSGPNFNAAAVPSLKQFIRDLTKEVPSPKGGSVYEEWAKDQAAKRTEDRPAAAAPAPMDEDEPDTPRPPRAPRPEVEVQIGTLGSGSDYTPFLQHIGVPSTDIGSDGPYGVYHSVFDNFAWFTLNADPTFVYEQQQARVFGLEILHMASADVLPYDYALYGREILNYVHAAQRRATAANLHLDFTATLTAARRFAAAGNAIHTRQLNPGASAQTLNRALRDAETALLAPGGLPGRPWYRHTIYAPGEFTGYAAVVIPGVNEAIDQPNQTRAQTQLTTLAAALNRSAALLE